MIQRWLILLAGLAIGLIAPLSAQAAVTCSLTTVGVAFGSYDVFSPAPLTSTGSVTISCTGVGSGSAPVSVSLNTGNSGSFQPRRMFRGSETMSYNLFLDAGNTQTWGNGTGGTLRYNALVSNNRPVSLNIFGRIPPGQDITAGTYTDTIVATIDF